jgi:glycosyl hydrolase family 123
LKILRVASLLLAATAALLSASILHAADVEIVGKATAWRRYVVMKTEDIRFEDGSVAPGRRVRQRRGYKLQKAKSASHTPLPPADWAGLSFDDRAWPRRRLPLHTGRGRSFSLMCTRARFNVADPAKVGDLTLSVAYRGGVVVYLNGEEIAQDDLPKGKIDLHTPATDYPKDAYLNPKGFLLRIGWNDSRTYKDRFAKRNRTLSNVKVPASKLRKGVNVLALEVHRPPTNAVLYTAKPEKYSWNYCPWETMRLTGATLTAPKADGLAPMPAGLSVSNAMTATRVIGNDPGDIHNTLRPVQFDGARNGAFCGQVVVSSLKAIKALKVTASDLKGAGGAAIKADAVQVRYPRRDSLFESAPAEVGVDKTTAVAVQPLWLTVHMPRDAAPGAYSGTLTISADGADAVTVPLKLSVANWTAPDPKDFPSRFDLVQSPETLATKYKVALWSEAHWKLIDRSFELMGQLGSRVLYIPMFRESHMGNEHSMVRWVKKTAPSTGSRQAAWSHDFSIVERYIDTALKRLGKVDMICLHTWAVRSGGAYFGMAKNKRAGMPYRFSILDPKTGKLTAAEGPLWSERDKAVAFIKPVFDGIRKLAKARGVEGALMVGTGHDIVPSKDSVAALKRASGSMRWVMHCHPQRWSCGSEPVGYLAHVWGTAGPTSDPKRRRYAWKEKRMYTTFPRSGSGMIGKVSDSSPPMQYRLMPETAMCSALKGFGWVGADFWPVVKTPRGVRPYLDRYPAYDRRTNLGIGHAFTHILDPGPDGAIATVRSEMVREGSQEAAARVFIEKILHDPAKKAKLGAGLAKKCQALLDARLLLLIRARSGWDLALCNGFEAQKAGLFALAAEVALATDGAVRTP